MTMPYQIITDSSCDLPQELADSYGLIVLPLSLTVDHKTYKNYLDGREIGFHELYEKFRSGSQTSTCAVNPEAFIEVKAFQAAAPAIWSLLMPDPKACSICL